MDGPLYILVGGYCNYNVATFHGSRIPIHCHLRINPRRRLRPKVPKGNLRTRNRGVGRSLSWI